jgi:hypothetical protein
MVSMRVEPVAPGSTWRMREGVTELRLCAADDRVDARAIGASSARVEVERRVLTGPPVDEWWDEPTDRGGTAP